MALIALFLLGTLNFALHKAVLESGHPLLGRLPQFAKRGRRFSLVAEFAVLLGAMLAVDTGSAGWAWAYAIYTMLNAIAAWLILTHRV